MRQSEQAYREVFDHAPVSLWVQDLSLLKQYLDGLRASGLKDFRQYVLENRQDMVRCAKMVRVLDVNDATVALFGAASREHLLQNLPKVLGEDARSTLWIEIMCLSAGKTRCGGNINARTLSGDALRLRFTWQVVPGHESDMSRVLLSLVERTPQEFAEHSLKQFRHVVDAMVEGVILFGAEGEVLQANPAAAAAFGLGPTELGRRSLGSERWGMLGQDGEPVPSHEFPAVVAHRTREAVHERVLGVQRTEGEVLWLTVSAAPLVDADGRIEGVVCTFADITPLKALQERLRDLSLSDDLTGLHNRRAFGLLGDQALKVARRNGSGVMLIFVDVDHMKAINDTFGHPVGDDALCDVADVLHASFREADVVARYGGDEFVVLTIEGASEDGGALIGRLQTNLEEHVRERARPYGLTVSVGVAVSGPGATAGLERLVAEADAQMYRHKHA